MVAYALWNLFLACLPIAFGRALARHLNKTVGRIPAWHPATLALASLWLLLLPNAPYLLTEIRHFVLDPRWRDLTEAAVSRPAALRAAAAWGCAFALTGAIGVVTFLLAVRPVEHALRRHGVSIAGFRAVLFPLTALGVWLGLIPRFNSWDALTHPLDVLGAALWAITHAPTAACVAGFALVLAALYLVASAACDGWQARRA